MVTRHVNPIDISVQGPRFVAMSPPLISTLIVTRPISVVQQVATPPVSVATPPVSVAVPSISVATPPRQVVVSASGAYVPAFRSPFDGTGVVTTSYPATSVSSFGTAVSTGYSASVSRVAVPFGSAITTVPRIPTVNSVFPPPSVFQSPSESSVYQSPLVPTVLPIPLVPPAVSIPSAYSHSSFSGGVSQTVYRPVSQEQMELLRRLVSLVEP